MDSYRYNPLFVGRQLYCIYRGLVEVTEVSREYFKVVNINTIYEQKYNDIGKTLFFSKNHIDYKTELYKFDEYIFFFPQWEEKNKEYVEKINKGIFAKDAREIKIQKIRETDSDRINRRKSQKQIINNLTSLEKKQDSESFNRYIRSDKEKHSNTYLEESNYLCRVNDFIDIRLNELEETYFECKENLKFTYSPTAEEIAARSYDLAEAERIKSYRELLLEVMDSPYFARMDFNIFDGEKSENVKMYIGKRSIDGNGGQLVYDWRSPIGQRYYLKNDLDFKYNEYRYNTLLRRAIQIEQRKLIGCNDEYIAGDSEENKGIGDPFLIKVLKRKRGQPRITDIIKTIQSNQNDIIRESVENNILVQGCAGSGKTMILMHRLSYILYNNSKMDVDRIKIITPSEVFDSQLNDLARELQLDKIERITIENYYIEKLLKYKIELKIKKDFELEQENTNIGYLQYVYSENFKKLMVEKIDSWYEEIEAKSRKLNLALLAKTYNINYSNGNYYKDKIDILRYIISQVIYYSNKNVQNKAEILGVIEAIDNEIESIKISIANVEKLMKELEIQYDCEIKKNQEEKNKIDEEIKSSEKELTINEDAMDINNKIKALNEELEECKKRSDLSIISSKKEELEIEYKKILEQLNSCSLFDFTKKRELREKISTIDDKMRELANPSTSVYIKSNGKILSINERIQQINEEIILCVNRLEEIKNQSAIKQKNLINKQKRRAQLEDEISKFEDTLIRFEKNYNDNQNKLLDKNNSRFGLINKLVELEKGILSEKTINDLKNFLKLLPENMNFIYSSLYTPIKKEAMNKFLIVEDKKLYRSDLVNLLYLAYYYEGPLFNNDGLLNIDEGQDISLYEYTLINDINGGKAKFNIYGDVNQLIKINGINRWDKLQDIIVLNYFKLNENYRNTVEITEFCNNNFSFNLVPIGISGPKVESYKALNLNIITLVNKFGIDTGTRKAIIVKNTEVNVYNLLKNSVSSNKLNYVISSKDNISTDKVNVLTVQMSKGLEFDSVLVFTEAMNKNEKYISTTRSLNKLIIVA